MRTHTFCFLFMFLLQAVVLAAPPVRKNSFGPNGTHWPILVDTPFPGDASTTPHVIDVACSWSAISKALASVTDEQANAGVLIRVAPGTLSGNGAGAGNVAVLKVLGSLSWKKRVTICPKEGFGTVSISDARFQDLFSIAFVGFEFSSTNFTSCSRSALVWSYIGGGFSSFYSKDNFTTEDFELVEVVFGTDATTSGADRSFFYVGGDGGYLKNFRIDGCYYAPKYRVAGVSPAPHVDTIQWGMGKGGAEMPTGFQFRDTVIYSSQTTAFQMVMNGTFENVFACGGSLARQLYPYTEGSDKSGGNYVFNGYGAGNRAIDCIFIGQHKFTNTDVANWAEVKNTRVNTNFKAPKPLEGQWIVDTSLDASDVSLLPPVPNAETRLRIWRWLESTSPKVTITVKME